ncbi:MAG: cation:proton antiporter [Clostridiales bacterium]|nr:cation:proton antiporter [Clostridiales bacterium]
MNIASLSEHDIVITLIALALLLLFAFAFGSLLEKIKGPRVVGEILGGMILGGSCLYFFFPDLISKLFMAYPEEGKVLNIFYQLGLIFLMFLSGFNTDIKADRKNAKTISLVFFGATVIPMLGSIPFFGLFRDAFIGTAGNDVCYKLVFAIGVAITSIPVISKIFFDMGIMNTTFSDTVLTVSTFQDLLLWILLNVATRIASSGEIDLLSMLLIVFMTLGIFVLIAVFSKFAKKVRTSLKSTTFYTLCFAALLMTCGLLYLAGINIMYSAFVVGYAVKAVFGKEGDTKERMSFLEKISFSFFVPVYFALVGLKLNVIHDFDIVRFLMFFGIAFGLEFLGTWFMMLFSGLKRATRINFAVTMNARGGPGIVLATVAYSYNIISIEFFTVLIITTMISSMTAGYWLRLQQKRDTTVFDTL